MNSFLFIAMEPTEGILTIIKNFEDFCLRKKKKIIYFSSLSTDIYMPLCSVCILDFKPILIPLQSSAIKDGFNWQVF